MSAPQPVDRPTAALIVIGDEILSGRTKDTNSGHLAERLTEKGIALREIRTVPDEPATIEEAVRALSAVHAHVFTCGGIGPTHDDITADCVARAMGASIGVREDARAILAEHYARIGTELNEARLRMARIPDGATLIDNPVSAAPGFSLGNVHVMAGVPKIFHAMVEGLLAGLEGGAPLVSETVRVERGEGDVAEPLAALARENPGMSFGSYPFQQASGRFGTNLVVRGPDPEAVRAAAAALRERLA